MNRHVPPHDFEPQDEAELNAPGLRQETSRDDDSREAVLRDAVLREEERRDAAAFSPRAAPDFQTARRHSRRVRWIKRLLPISIVAAIVLIAGVSILSRLSLTIELPFDIGHLTLSGSRLTMELPKLSGFTDDNRGYHVTAKTATQDLTRPDVIDLTDVVARLELADKGWTSVNAKVGSFDTKKQFITLGDGVDLAMAGGYAGRLQDAAVDVKAGTITTEHPVEFTYLDGKLVADRLAVTDRGKRAMFEGHVQLDFLPSHLPGRQNDAAAPAAGSAPAKPAVSPAAQARREDGAVAAQDPVQPPPPAPPLPSAPLPPRRPAIAP
ncbi:hypothetical protein EZH22_04315 [Xanthobacter dioxanivorans]|uniref:Lipopolysaccharide export system protein LptC n=1 Tax=Xanthobacter dioxanivorans TaxID=2528964 RepID=A0A974SJL8_9HYPH|nr:hypothetical protein [Xanthobacter dioxanivorans]QRG07627.1 hypothetical protein EZH22_04315 [Xanthobacter dioxanivorans]